MLGKIAASTLLLLLSALSSLQASPLEVFVSLPPQKWLSDHLGGDNIITHVLVKKGQDPHLYAPTPKQIAALSRSRIYFTLGMAFEKRISKKITQSVAGIQMVDSSSSVEKISMTAGHHDDHQQTDNRARKRHQDFLDPHIWLSPLNLKIMAATMAKALITLDPDNKKTYQQNLQILLDKLEKIHHRIERQLAPFQGASFYVFHPAFGYFAHAYGLRQEAVELEGKAPTLKNLSTLISKAKLENVQVIFVQPQFDQKSALSIARAIKGEVVPLDPLAEDVGANLQIMADKIHTALHAP